MNGKQRSLNPLCGHQDVGTPSCFRFFHGTPLQSTSPHPPRSGCTQRVAEAPHAMYC